MPISTLTTRQPLSRGVHGAGPTKILLAILRPYSISMTVVRSRHRVDEKGGFEFTNGGTAEKNDSPNTYHAIGDIFQAVSETTACLW